MTISVRIPVAFRDLASGHSVVKLSAFSVGGAVNELIRAFPAVADRIREPDGTLKKAIGVYLNREDVRFRDGMETELSDGDEVMLLPPASGG
jgi:molybdopterin converting factor small subunit